MTNVLVPTDFSLRSLDLVGFAAKSIPGKLDFFLFHAFDMPDSLLDAMHRVGFKGHGDLITEDIRLKCKKLKAEHPAIGNIAFRIMYGTTVSVFKDYARANGIDVLVMPATSFVPATRESVNYESMFRKSGLRIISNAPQDSGAGTDADALIEPQPMYMQRPAM
ncbi:MAG: universal stress protein [Bacteroidota bacterium]